MLSTLLQLQNDPQRKRKTSASMLSSPGKAPFVLNATWLLSETVAGSFRRHTTLLSQAIQAEHLSNSSAGGGCNTYTYTYLINADDPEDWA